MKLRKQRQNVMAPHITGERPSISAILTVATMAAIITSHSSTIAPFHDCPPELPLLPGRLPQLHGRQIDPQSVPSDSRWRLRLRRLRPGWWRLSWRPSCPGSGVRGPRGSWAVRASAVSLLMSSVYALRSFVSLHGVRGLFFFTSYAPADVVDLWPSVCLLVVKVGIFARLGSAAVVLAVKADAV